MRTDQPEPPSVRFCQDFEIYTTILWRHWEARKVSTPTPRGLGMRQHPPPSGTTEETLSTGWNDDDERQSSQWGHWEESIGQEVRVSEDKQKGFGGTRGVSSRLGETSMRMSVRERRGDKKDFHLKRYWGKKVRWTRASQKQLWPRKKAWQGHHTQHVLIFVLQDYTVAVATGTGSLRGWLCVGKGWHDPMGGATPTLYVLLRARDSRGSQILISVGISQGL